MIIAESEPIVAFLSESKFEPLMQEGIIVSIAGLLRDVLAKTTPDGMN